MDSPERCSQKILKKLKKLKILFMWVIYILIVAALGLLLEFIPLEGLICLEQIRKQAAPTIFCYLCRPNLFQKGALNKYATVAELVDASDLKLLGRKVMPVRFWPVAKLNLCDF